MCIPNRIRTLQSVTLPHDDDSTKNTDRMKRLLLPLLAITLAFAPARGQDITGDWYGTLEIGPQKLALVFHISENEGRYATVMDSPDQHGLRL